MNQIEIIKQKIHQLLLDNIPDISVNQLTDGVELFSLGLTSLSAVSLVLGIEDIFGFQFDLDEISFDRFRAVSDIVELVTKKVEQK